jgi:prevent-host-death family protein
MACVNIYEAKTHLSRLLERACEGEEIVIARAGRPVARLVPIGAVKPRVLGADAGVFSVPDDFDAPLSERVLAGFEGKVGTPAALRRRRVERRRHGSGARRR